MAVVGAVMVLCGVGLDMIVSLLSLIILPLTIGYVSDRNHNPAWREYGG